MGERPPKDWPRMVAEVVALNTGRTVDDVMEMEFDDVLAVYCATDERPRAHRPARGGGGVTAFVWRCVLPYVLFLSLLLNAVGLALAAANQSVPWLLVHAFFIGLCGGLLAYWFEHPEVAR